MNSIGGLGRSCQPGIVPNSVCEPKASTPLERAQRVLAGTALFTLLSLVPVAALADWVGTAINRIILDPQSLPVVADGFQLNDEISYILETTPSETGSTVGSGAWATAYIPAGVEVTGAELVTPSGTTYIRIPAKDVGPMSEDCGPRGCDRWTEIANAFEDAPLGPGQQDTGIFYSIDSRTAKLASPLAATPSGSGAQSVWSQWDFDQVVAFGMKKNIDPTWPLINPGSDGKGNPALVSSDGGATWAGTGSPVAGPDTFFTNDYNPDCDLLSSALADDTQCEGPWQRIEYENAKIGGLAGGAALTPPATATNVLVNNAVLTTTGHDLGADGALPVATNAVRFVHGIRRLGDLEYARITFRIVDVAAYVQSVFVDRDFCLDGTGSDTDKPGRGAQDNVFRYYEGNPHSCYAGSADANFVKFARAVNGEPAAGGNLAPGDIVSYELVFTNTSDATVYDIDFSDTNDLNLDLIAPGDPDCTYPSYGSVPAGLTYIGAGLPATASWTSLSSLDAGESVSVFVCAEVDAGLSLGEQVINGASATYGLSSGGSTEPILFSTTLGTVSSQLAGAVYHDLDASGDLTAGDLGLGGVTVELWNDSTGSIGDDLDGGDTLLRTGVTASDGSYEFNGFFGDLLVVVTDSSGYTSTGDQDNGAVCGTGNGCNVIGAITLADDEKSLGNDFYDYLPPSTDLSLVQGVSDPVAAVGSTVTFTLELSNAGPSTATGIDVVNVLPDGFTYVVDSMTGGDTSDQAGAPTLAWRVDSLGAGGMVTLTLQATVNPGGTYVNIAQVTGSDQGDVDSTPDNDDGDQSEDDESIATVTPAAVIDLSLVNTVNNPIAASGSTVTFSLLVSNGGPSNATNIEVTDLLPDGFAFVPDTMTGGDSRNQGGAPSLLWNIDSLSAGASTTLTFQAVVNASGGYRNIAQVTGSDQGDSDSTPGNDDGDASEDDEDSAVVVSVAEPPPTGPPEGDSGSGGAVAVPTLGEYGVLMLCLLLAGVGSVSQRRLAALSATR